MSTNNNTPLSGEELSLLQRLCREAQELRDAYDRESHDPSEELGRLKREAHQEASAAAARHEKEMEDLKQRHREEINAVHKKTEGRRQELKETLQTLQAAYTRKRDSKALQVNDVVERATFAELVSTLPENVRPNLIPVPGQEMFLLQIKAAPTCALIVKAKAGGDTKWGAEVATHIASREHRLVCFCSAGCMDDAGRVLTKDAICDVCEKHSIQKVFGRHPGGGHRDIVFYDGDSFEEVMEQMGVSRDGQYAWIC